MNFPKSPDVVTLGAVGAAVYTLGALSHEGLGHGVTCIALGGRIEALTSTYLQCSDGLSRISQQAIEASGTLVNLAFGIIALALLAPRVAGWARAFWFVFGTVNILQAGGYLLVSPLAHFGDWNAFVEGIAFEWGWRFGLTGVGLLISLWGARTSARLLASMVGADADRGSRIRLMTWAPFAFGCATDIFAAMFNPIGWELVLVSSIGSAVFGTCWFVFMVPPFAKNSPSSGTAVTLRRSVRLIAFGIVAAAVHVWFGRGFQAK